MTHASNRDDDALGGGSLKRAEHDHQALPPGDTKPIRCPVCSHRVANEPHGEESETRILLEGEEWQGAISVKCDRCKKRVGIRKLNHGD